jgi:hypothetical protein
LNVKLNRMRSAIGRAGGRDEDFKGALEAVAGEVF